MPESEIALVIKWILPVCEGVTKLHWHHYTTNNCCWFWDKSLHPEVWSVPLLRSRFSRDWTGFTGAGKVALCEAMQ